MHLRFLMALAFSLVFMLPSCSRKEPAPARPGAQASPAAHAAEDHHAGAVIELGETAAGKYRIRASRDDGKIVAGGDAPIDVWVDPAGEAPKVTAVRFWIGTKDAKGSRKARAEIEVPTEPNHWHTHAEIPKPEPEGSRLWVEVEHADGGKTIADFDLKAAR